MINIINVDIHCDDKRKITAVEVKLKSFKNGKTLSGHPLLATVSTAFFKTTLLTDEGQYLKTALDPKRNNIVDLIIPLKQSNDLTLADIANFLDAFQKALDETNLGF